MQCFRHDPGKVCPECGLDRRAKVKLRVQAQHLQAGDIVGSGEVVVAIVQRSISIPTNKVMITLHKGPAGRSVYWGKTTIISIERAEKANAD